MDRLDEIRAFAAVAEARSFTQGARKLDVSGAPGLQGWWPGWRTAWARAS